MIKDQLFYQEAYRGETMQKLIFITGGARSGKSTLAEKKAKEIGQNIVYIATGLAFDEGMKDRIKKHKESRPKEWSTIEQYKDFHYLDTDENFLNADTVLLDCVTLMVSNLLIENDLDFENTTIDKITEIESKMFSELNTLINLIEKYNKNFIAVTNEIGMGLVPPYRLGRVFRDMAGRANQYLADKAHEVYFTVSGIPMKIK